MINLLKVLLHSNFDLAISFHLSSKFSLLSGTKGRQCHLLLLVPVSAALAVKLATTKSVLPFYPAAHHKMVTRAAELWESHFHIIWPRHDW